GGVLHDRLLIIAKIEEGLGVYLEENFEVTQGLHVLWYEGCQESPCPRFFKPDDHWRYLVRLAVDRLCRGHDQQNEHQDVDPERLFRDARTVEDDVLLPQDCPLQI